MTDALPGTPRRESPWHPLDFLLLSVLAGLVAGGIEVVVHAVRQRLFGQTLFMGPEHIWQIPLAEAAVFLGIGLLLLPVSLLWRPLRAPRAALGIFGTLAALAPLLIFERIHVGAEIILALAGGVVTARLLASRGSGLVRTIRMAAPAILVLAVATGAARGYWHRGAERRAMRALPEAAAGRPNILLLVLDTVRAWNLGLYGYGRPTTPHLKAWAARGVVFSRAFAPAPWTTLSHATMFTGQYPTDLSVDWNRPFDGSKPTLAEALAAAGYATGGFVANYTHVGSSTGLAKGFLHYDDYPSQPLPVLRRTGLLGRLLVKDRVAAFIGRRRMIEAGTGASVSANFLGWLDGQRGAPRRPWFAFLNYYEAHGPYLPPAPYDTMFFARPAPVAERYWTSVTGAYGRPPVPLEQLIESLDAYDGGIAYLDAEVDALLRALVARGDLQNTVVVITSDHGELFGEHGVIAHGNSLYLPSLYVPLIVIAPGRAPAGVRVPSVASLRDLPATLLTLSGVPNPGLPGRSLSALWEAPDPSRTDTLFASLDYNRLLPRFPPSPVLRGSMRTVVLDSLQFILNGDGVEELYHLGRDPWQVRNLAQAPEYATDLARYRGALATIIVRQAKR
ncbi:MAG: sulfatase-like hydrolase/transferase [Gemmatimonadales bacterium]|nr:sulfatase-like hydrolase/transferase [Gemmatimonadales bacterium]